MVAVEQLQERSLGARGSLGTQQPDGAENIIQVAQIHDQVVEP